MKIASFETQAVRIPRSAGRAPRRGVQPAYRHAPGSRDPYPPLAALPNGLTSEWMPWSTTLFKELPKLEDGELVLPERRGFGLEFDEAVIKRYAM